MGKKGNVAVLVLTVLTIIFSAIAMTFVIVGTSFRKSSKIYNDKSSIAYFNSILYATCVDIREKYYLGAIKDNVDSVKEYILNNHSSDISVYDVTEDNISKLNVFFIYSSKEYYITMIFYSDLEVVFSRNNIVIDRDFIMDFKETKYYKKGDIVLYNNQHYLAISDINRIIYQPDHDFYLLGDDNKEYQLTLSCSDKTTYNNELIQYNDNIFFIDSYIEKCSDIHSKGIMINSIGFDTSDLVNDYFNGTLIKNGVKISNINSKIRR